MASLGVDIQARFWDPSTSSPDSTSRVPDYRDRPSGKTRGEIHEERKLLLFAYKDVLDDCRKDE